MSQQSEVTQLNQSLLDSIAAGNFSIYKSLCADDLTCFEPETRGVLVEGISFHKYYFDLDKSMKESTNGLVAPALPITNISMSNPHVRCLGDDYVILSYTRVDQCLDKTRSPVTKTMCETRVWEKREGKWVHVHFHKS